MTITPGYYWCKWERSSESPQIVEVFGGEAGDIMSVNFCGTDAIKDLTELMKDATLSGPLEYPALTAPTTRIEGQGIPTGTHLYRDVEVKRVQD